MLDWAVQLRINQSQIIEGMMSMIAPVAKQWRLSEYDRKTARRLAHSLGLFETTACLLVRRGVTTPDQAEKFLRPKLTDLHTPFLMKDMEKACVRIFEAVEAKEKILIYADYDCDGIPGAVILQSFFKKIGYENFNVYPVCSVSA